jgi:uncharacterized glyoxalase superfamily protein PhnB
MIDQLFPILSTTDVARSLGFWRDLMGGTVAFEWPGPERIPAYVGVDVGASHIGIGLAADGRVAPPGAISLWVYVDDCDSVVRHLRDAGVTVTAEPEDQPWGERVARVLDPDGNEVIVGQRARSSPTDG